MTSERFLVTGALGCIGAWTVKRLLEQQVCVSTYDVAGDPHRLRLILSDDDLARLNTIRGDVTDLDAFERVVVENDITHIVHLAAMQVPFVRADPVRGADVNVVGTTVVLETVKRHAEQIRGLVYASSIGVYGSKDLYPPGPLAHDAPLHPPNLYGVFKEANEGTARIYWEENRVRSIGLRPYIVYGPGRDQGWTAAPTKAMLAAAVGKSYAIGFGGRAVFHHAADVADAMIRAARVRIDGAPVYNLGGTTCSMAEVVTAIEETVPEAAGKITFDPTPLPFPPSTDERAFQSSIGPCTWTPFLDGVRQTVEHFRRAVASGKLDADQGLGSAHGGGRR